MGSAGIRAVSLCDNSLIEKINRHFVPLVLEMNYRARVLASSRSPEGQRLIASIERHFGPRDALLQTFVVSSAGAILDGASPMGPSKTVISAQVDDAIQRLHLAPGPPVANYKSNSHSASASVELRLVLRYASETDIAQLIKLHPLTFLNPAYHLYPAALHTPVRDWITLTEEQCAKLLPPDGLSVGGAYVIDDILARAVLSHFRPEPALMEPDGDAKAVARVTAARLSATVVSLDASSGRVSLAGSLEMYHPGLRPESVGPSPSDQNQVRAEITGYLEWDRATRRIKRCALATRNATYSSPAKDQVRFEAVAYRVGASGER